MQEDKDSSQIPQSETENLSPIPQNQRNNQAPEGQKNSAGIIVLQWLTYAFWGWLILGLIWLTAVITSNLIASADVDGMIPYAIAASVVLLPIAFFTDLFYRKYEPAKKSGAATVIMVIHAVIFALFGIGALIATVFTVLSLSLGTSGSGSNGQVAAIITELVAALLYATAFFRTLNPLHDNTKKVAKIYAYSMLIFSIILLGLGFFGPMLKAISERDDRRIETNLPLVQSSINDYVRDSAKLPATLGDVDYKSQDADSLVKDGLVRYELVSNLKDVDMQNPDNTSQSEQKYRYKLCVTYKGAKNDTYSTYSTREEYSDYLNVYSHPAGEVCYKLSVGPYYDYYTN